MVLSSENVGLNGCRRRLNGSITHNVLLLELDVIPEVFPVAQLRNQLQDSKEDVARLIKI